MKTSKTYLAVMALELACIEIKYRLSNTGTFQPLTLLLFLTAMFSNVLASRADKTKRITIITFHVSGMVACETLLWILFPHPLYCSIINFVLLLLATLLFFNFLTQPRFIDYITHLRFINHITQLLHDTPPDVDQMPNIESQPHEDQV